MSSLSKKVFSDNLVVMTGEVILRVFYFAFFIVYVRLLSPFELSVLPIFAMIAAVVATVSNLGLPVSVVREVPRLIDDDREIALSLIQSSTALSVLVALFFSILAYVLAPIIAGVVLKSWESAYIIQWMSVGFFLYAVDVALSYNMRALSQFHGLTVKNTVLGISERLLGIAFYLIWGIKGLVMGFNVSLILGVSLSLYFLRGVLFKRVKKHSRTNLVKFSFPYYIEGFLTFLQGQADQVIVATFFSPLVLAKYYVAKRLSDSVELFKESLDQTLTPALSKLSNLGKSGMEDGLRKAVTIISFFAVPLCLLASSCSYAFLFLAGKGSYLDATGIAVLLCVSAVFLFFIVPVTRCIFVLAKPVEKLKLTAVQSICFVGFLILFVSALDIVGAALGRLAYVSLSLVYALFVLKRIIRVRLDLGTIGKSILASLAMALFVASAQLVYFSIYLVPVYILGGCILWIFTSLVLLKKSEIQTIVSVLPKSKTILGFVSRFGN